MPRDETYDARTLMPDWYAREKRLAHMLPYVRLVEVKGLDQIVVRTGVKSFNLVVQGIAGREQENRHHVVFLSQVFQPFQPRLARQVDVEKEQIVSLLIFF